MKNIAIILISAIDNLDIVASYIRVGADDFLPKPFNNTLLKLEIRNALECRNSRLQLHSARQPNQEFCRLLAHDLNNSLTGIMMTAELLLMEQNSGLSKQRLEEIIAATEQISTLIKQRKRASGGRLDNKN